MALSSRSGPSIVTLRLSSARVPHVNAVLSRVMPALVDALREPALITVEDRSYRIRRLPFRDRQSLPTPSPQNRK